MAEVWHDLLQAGFDRVEIKPGKSLATAVYGLACCSGLANAPFDYGCHCFADASKYARML